ncbi:uncharacterized protein LOC122874975 [Siniperca chuatsi]|uniref:uncharacterized protein LOC122874975 n=1 Tax=Siniperca chuatsi TaxID=119488 RepID=UPI001CE0D50B|nr:uncharacterized protein LOC122874975 [Siniperca chuatsi]
MTVLYVKLRATPPFCMYGRVPCVPDVSWWATEPPRSLYVSVYLFLLVCSGCPLSVWMCVCVQAGSPISRLQLITGTPVLHHHQLQQFIYWAHPCFRHQIVPPYIHSRSAGDHCLSLLFRSSGPQLPRHSRHPVGPCLRTLPVKHTTRPAPMIFRLVGSASPLRSPARRQLASSPSRVPSVTSPTLPSRIRGEATGDAGFSIYHCL